MATTGRKTSTGRPGPAGSTTTARPDASDNARTRLLLQKLRLRRVVEEKKFSDDVVVWSSRRATPDGAEARTLNAINLGNAQAQMGSAGDRQPAPTLDVIKRLDDVLVLRANPSALISMREASPGLRIAPVAYAYPQYLRALGDELDNAALQVAPGTKVKKFSVRFATADGTPVAGVKVKALVDWEGAHVPAVTGANGIAEFGIPVVYPEVAMLLVEPEHTHWSVYAKGFERSAAPKRVEVLARPLVPDAFQLIGHYAPYDEQAGAGVTVAVIDSGVGPHEALTVAGGACFVTGDDPADFLDNGIGHGTHVAGTIAARRVDGKAVYGLAPACRLLAYRVCPRAAPRDRAKSSDIAAALERAIVDQCDLVNISMGSLEAMPEVPDVLAKVRAAGIVVIAATGNDGQERLRYPARYSHTQACGAMGKDHTFPADCPEAFQESEVRRGDEFVADFSNHGLETDFIAPGVAVLSTYPGHRYAMMSGTSMATPYTTGMAARLLSKRPDLLTMPRGPERADAIIQLLTQAARKVGFPAPYEGFGVLK